MKHQVVLGAEWLSDYAIQLQPRDNMLIKKLGENSYWQYISKGEEGESVRIFRGGEKGEMDCRRANLTNTSEKTMKEHEEKLTWNRQDLQEAMKMGTMLKEEEGHLKEKLMELVERHPEVFPKSKKVTISKLKPLEIEMKEGTHPISLPRHKFPQDMEWKIQCKVEEGVKQGLIVKTTGYARYNAPLVPMETEEGNLDLHYDLRSVNRDCRLPGIKIPDIHEVTSIFWGRPWISDIQFIGKYSQMPLHENSREYVAFSTKLPDIRQQQPCQGLQRRDMDF